ncbi:hypothetical protein DS901_11370 [Loktanella sp. D2R18]|uniref:dynamin family protein n=1 Tax=Rhodobacterales TaxID=204455 RepID=UPI000DEA1A9C|nr:MULTISPECIES: dynamin family protein [Rhodobacterales]MDO6590355.1 dynamin family protein [Yoonia sp. 1_MG-2023]RBW42844.1 hypothetical protein DS901_11370 [Loktanella sp. D2R18]
MSLSTADHDQQKKLFPASMKHAQAARIAVERLEAIAQDMQRLVVPDALGRALEIQQNIPEIKARISIVGQVKAGKTALTNALIGRPGLLPSDVNPWTSVITSLHMNPSTPPKKGAVFQFFDKDEWANMTAAGGRLGEFAGRTNFEREADEMREQVRALQSHAQNRLGVNFTLLLGNKHSFSEFDSALIKKYVCLGDDDDADVDPSGRFADLTKSADLYFEDSSFPMPVILADTPGVNDPFLVREAVTLDNLASSNICVIVLSAHQALSTVDIGLINIIMGLHHEQVVLFVNRIDELEDPKEQTVEIKKYIQRTLKDRNMSQDIPIVFGSAKWGAELGLAPDGDDGDKADLSGISELMRVLDEKSTNDVSWPAIEALRDECTDLVNRSVLVLDNALSERNVAGIGNDADAISLRTSEIYNTMNADLDALINDVIEMASFAMSDAYRSFIVKESRELSSAVTKGKGLKNWAPQTEGLRKELFHGYNEFSNRATAKLGEVIQNAANSISALYADIVGSSESLFPVVGPAFEQPKTPVFLMKTMSIDLSAGWLGRLTSKQRKATSYVAQFEKLATEEMLSTVSELKRVYIYEFAVQSRAKLQDFIDAHIATIRNITITEGAPEFAQTRQSFGLENEVKQRITALSALKEDLQSISRDTQGLALGEQQND